MILKDYKLCYVQDRWAYFTTQPLQDQTGDDWNDAPYQHNAGTPYYWQEGDTLPKWEIIKIGLGGDWSEPSEFYPNFISVDQINAGEQPWLKKGFWSNKECIEVRAGISLYDFLLLFKFQFDEVYLPAEDCEDILDNLRRTYLEEKRLYNVAT